MEMPPKNYYHESVQGQIFDKKEDAVDAAIDGAGAQLYDLLKNPEKDYSANAGTLINNKNAIVTAFNQLQRAFEGKLVVEYKLSGK